MIGPLAMIGLQMLPALLNNSQSQQAGQESQQAGGFGALFGGSNPLGLLGGLLPIVANLFGAGKPEEEQKQQEEQIASTVSGAVTSSLERAGVTPLNPDAPHPLDNNPFDNIAGLPNGPEALQNILDEAGQALSSVQRG